MKTDVNKYKDEKVENIYNVKNEDKYSYKTIGLTEDVIREISEKKGEPEWLLDIRLKALKMYEKLPMPNRNIC